MVACPRVSVVMPVLDAEAYLREAIESILSQTFKDFELLVISEHGTSSESIAAIESYSDDRIRHIHNLRRLGIAKSRNVGIRKARGQYIAWMDADDVSMPERLEKQVKFLDEHPEVGVLGTGFEVIDGNGRVVSRHKLPTGPALTKWLLPFRDANVIANPTSMVRRTICEALKGYGEWEWAEDYDFWLRSSNITKIDNLPHILLRYRKHEGNISRRYQGLFPEASMSHQALTATIGRGASFNVVRALVRPYRHYAPTAKDALNAALLLCRGYPRYVSSEPMSKREGTLILHDVANRLVALSLTCARRNPIFSVVIYCHMIRLCREQIPWVMGLTVRSIIRVICRNASRILGR